RFAFAVIESRVVTEFGFQQLHLFVGAGGAGNGTSMEPAELAGDAANGARSRGHEHRFSGFRAGDGEEAHVGCHTGHAEDAEVVRELYLLFAYLAQALPVRQRLILPAEDPVDVVPFREVRVPALRDLSDHATLQHLAKPERRYVGPGIVHAPAHIRVDGKVDVTHQDLAFGGFRQRRFRLLEVLRGHPAAGAARQPDLDVRTVTHLSAS